MTKIILSGCNGTMGKVITNIVSEMEEYEIVAGIDFVNTKSDSYPVYDNTDNCNEKADAIIDFSHPSALEKVLNFAIIPDFFNTINCCNYWLRKKSGIIFKRSFKNNTCF
jgi:4-hydroxy-tetrahydrodipicolinate reductase